MPNVRIEEELEEVDEIGERIAVSLQNTLQMKKCEDGGKVKGVWPTNGKNRRGGSNR